MDPRELQRLAREHFAADNALRAAPEPTAGHAAEYVTTKARLDLAVEQVQNRIDEIAEEVLRDREEEQDGSD